MTIDDMVQIIIVGLCTGIGSSLGNYITNKMLIRQIEKIQIVPDVKKDENV